jgi:hypothetical protein
VINIRTQMAGSVFALGLLFNMPTMAGDEMPDVTEEGLIKLQDTELALVYAKEGVDLSVYDKVWLGEATVAFKKNWKRDQNRSYYAKVSDRDMQRIKADLAELFREVFADTLDAAGHELVAEAAEDVLFVRPGYRNLLCRTTRRYFSPRQSAPVRTVPPNKAKCTARKNPHWASIRKPMFWVSSISS